MFQSSHLSSLRMTQESLISVLVLLSIEGLERFEIKPCRAAGDGPVDAAKASKSDLSCDDCFNAALKSEFCKYQHFLESLGFYTDHADYARG